MPPTERRTEWPLAALLTTVVVATGWSAIRPADYATWFFELFLGLAGVGVLAATYRAFRFSPVVYLVAAVHFVVLAIGAKYTYAEAPPGDWLEHVLHLARNPWDRVGHFFQGLTPALVVRELLLRRAGLTRGWVVNVLAVSVALAFSASYEILEWLWVLAFYPDKGPEWLGMQGDPWDAQGDMCMALCGAIFGLVVLGRLQDRSLLSHDE